MKQAEFKDKLAPLLKHWAISLVLLPFVLLYAVHMFKALSFNIFMAVDNNYPAFFSFVFFILKSLTTLFHEGGHGIFRIFGSRFITIAGGSFMQLLIPALCLGYGYLNNKRWIIQLSWFYLGYNFIDVAAYAADAGARALPLIGGLGKSAHDWHNLLVMTGSLQHDAFIGYLLFWTGCACFALALLLPAWRRDYQYADLDLDLG